MATTRDSATIEPAHDDNVDELAVDVCVLAPYGFTREAGALVGAQGALVGREHLEPHTVQIQIAERKVDEQPHGLRSISESAGLLFADANLQLRRPMHAIDRQQLAGADQPAAAREPDGKDDRVASIGEAGEPCIVL